MTMVLYAQVVAFALLEFNIISNIIVLIILFLQWHPSQDIM